MNSNGKSPASSRSEPGALPSAGELRQIIHEEFIHWFSMYGYSRGEPIPDHSAGPEEQYEAIAQDIWKLIQGGANGA